MNDFHGKADIEEIVRQGLVYTCFQPLISVRRQEITGFEALGRGFHPITGATIPPDLLFSEAKRRGLTLELDRLLRSKALDEFSRQAGASTHYILSLNIATSILAQATGSGHLLSSVLESGLEPGRVMIEILESEIDDTGALLDFVQTYRDRGFLIALDDIGSGFSNLDRISMIKPDVLKLDKSLLDSIETEYHARVVVRSLIGMAHATGSLVIAEGVETEGQTMILLESGADMLQGYYFARPSESIASAETMVNSLKRSVSAALTRHLIDKVERRRLRHRRFGTILDRIAAGLAVMDEAQFDEQLAKSILCDSAIECLYTIDETGRQSSGTVFGPSAGSGRRDYLVQPGVKGTDQSAKDYFFLVAGGLEKYTTDPYISIASRNICVTISRAFRGVSGRSHVLCMDIVQDENDVL